MKKSTFAAFVGAMIVSAVATAQFQTPPPAPVVSSVSLTGGSNGNATVAANGTSGIVLTTGGGKTLSLSNSTGNATITGAWNTSGNGAGGALFCSGTGSIQITGDTHANRSSAAGVWGYCTTDQAWYFGNGTTAFDVKPGTTCTLNGASPSVCTAVVNTGAICNCNLIGTTAAVAAAGCATSLSGTTLTITSANALTNVVNINCDR